MKKNNIETIKELGEKGYSIDYTQYWIYYGMQKEGDEFIRYKHENDYIVEDQSLSVDDVESNPEHHIIDEGGGKYTIKYLDEDLSYYDPINDAFGGFIEHIENFGIDGDIDYLDLEIDTENKFIRILNEKVVE